MRTRYDNLWQPAFDDALELFLHRQRRHRFTDAPICGVRIEEFWHSDVNPSCSEQSIIFARAEIEAFHSIEDFASIFAIVAYEQDLADNCRPQFFDDLCFTPLGSANFCQFWLSMHDRAPDAPEMPIGSLLNAVSLFDEWNDKLYAGRTERDFIGIYWSTTA